MGTDPCGHENVAGAAFCLTCGVARDPVDDLVTCRSCEAALPVDAAFCSACGTPVARSETFTFDGERRQLTIVFCDLVGSTELGARLDAEQYQEVVDAYYQLCGESISANGGYVANYIGDGVLAYFGYPQALEDAATRAVRSALALQRAVTEANEAGGVGPDVPISVRVGVHTGLAVIDAVGASSRREVHALGDAMNVAARVQGAAAPGEVFLTEPTLRLLDDRFTIELRGSQQLKGLTEPVRLFRAVAEGADHRTAATSQRQSGPFVGRSDELASLLDAWRVASAGHGQIVAIIGEPGVGKSRLIQRVRHELGPGVRWVEGQASSYGATTPFAAMSYLIDHELSARGLESPAQRAAALADELGDEGARLLGGLIGLDRAGEAAIVSAEADRRRTLEHLVAWMRNLTDDGPAVLVLEDLHWADASSVESLTALIDTLAGTPLLLVVTSRPEDPPALATEPPASVLKLDRLGADDTRAIIADALGRTTDPAVLDQLVERSDGVPLFAEELARTLAQGTAEHLGAVPPTLQDSLMARIDALGAAKPIAQVAAVVGKEFSPELVASVAGIGAADVEVALDALVDAEIITGPLDRSPRTFVFRHALVQQAAYDALLSRDRRDLHGRVADLLGSGDVPELAAQHLSLAGRAEPAADAWALAGSTAAARKAWQEARAHFTNAIQEVRRLDASPATIQRELDLELMLLRAVEMGGGFAGGEAIACIDRARLLAERLGEPEARIPVMFGMWSTTLSAGRVEASMQLAEEIQRAAESSGSPTHHRQAHIALAGTAYNMCRLDDAINHAAAVLEAPAAVTDMERGQALMYGSLAETIALEPRSGGTWAGALTTLALDGGDDVIATIIARVGASVGAVWRRDYLLVGQLAALLQSDAETFGMPMFGAWADIYGGWATAMSGGDGDAAGQIVRGLRSHIELEQALGLNHSFALLAEAQLEQGSPEAARVSTEEGLAAAPERDQPVHAAELRRLRAATSRELGFADLVDDDLRIALDVATSAGCRLIAVRAATQLAEWAAEEGRPDPATELVAILADLDAGLDHPDVVAARATARTLRERHP